MIVISESEFAVILIGGVIVYYVARIQWREPAPRDIPEWILELETDLKIEVAEDSVEE